MSLVVLGLVLLLAIPVFLVGAITKSKVLLNVTAIAAGVIGLATGNPAYAFVDLLGVGVAYYFGLSFTTTNKLGTSTLTSIDPSQPAPSAKDSGVHFLQVVGLCAVGGWILALDAVRKSGHYENASFFQLLFDPGFIGQAAAPAFALCAAAVLGWIVGKIITPMKPHASWVALTLAVGLFVALKTGYEIMGKRASLPRDFAASQNRLACSTSAAEIPLSNFSRGITQYYCGSEPDHVSISQGATFVIRRYGKDGDQWASTQYPNQAAFNRQSRGPVVVAIDR